MCELFRGESSVEQIRQLVCCIKILGLDMTCLDFITNEVAINLNMFGPFMKNWIGSNAQGSLIITVKKD